jgi:hypothetical protein
LQNTITMVLYSGPEGLEILLEKLRFGVLLQMAVEIFM